MALDGKKPNLSLETMMRIRSDWVNVLHTVFIYIGTITSTIICGLFAIAFSFFSQSGNLPHKVAQFWAKSILFMSRVRVEIIGSSFIKPGRSYIYMANHQSNFDIPVLLGKLPAQFRWLAKAELFRIPLFGRSMKGCGYISIDRSNREKAFKSLSIAASTIRAGTSVLIFPEGTRSVDGRIQDFKKGGFVMACDSGVSIIPLIIKGTRDIMPKKSWVIRPQTVSLTITKAVETSDYNRDTKDVLLQKVRAVICENYYENNRDKQECLK